MVERGIGRLAAVGQHPIGETHSVDKVSRFVGLIASLATIMTLALRYLPQPRPASLLTEPLLTLNGLRLLASLLVAVFLYRVLPLRLGLYHRRSRSRAFSRRWYRFKNVLGRYERSHDSSLQSEHADLRERLQRDLSYFTPATIRILRAFPGGDDAENSVSSLCQCFDIERLSEWRMQVGRRIPEEIDCFDRLILALVEHCDDQQYWEKT
jgi:hypothetical protein